MHSSAIYKGYALYKIDGKKYIATIELCGVHLPQNIFSEFLLLLFRDMLLIFLGIFFPKHVHICGLSLCLFMELFSLYIFHSYMCCCFFFKLV